MKTVFLLFLFLVFASCGKSVNKLENKMVFITQRNLQKIHPLIYDYIQDFGLASLKAALLETPKRNVYLEELIERMKIEDRTLYVDGWGRRFRCAYLSKSIVVWSYGANGNDECGKGDDICLAVQLDERQP